MQGGRLRILGVAIAIGFSWLVLELGFILVDDRAVDPVDALRSFARAMPWQLFAFAVLGVPLSLVWRRPGAWSGFDVLALATLLFVGTRISEGVVRREHIPVFDVIVRVGGLLLGTSLLASLLAGAGRLLPPRLSSRWLPALVLAWGLLLVPALHRGSALLALGGLPGPGALLEPREVAFAAAVLLVVLLTGIWPRAWPAVPVVLLLPLLGAVRNGPGDALVADGAERPDVMVIVIDTLRGDQLGPRPGGRSLTPAFDAVVAESIQFTRAYSPGNQTLLAMPAVLTSLSPLSVGRRLMPSAVTLAEHLQDAGYATIGISANPFISARLGYDQGFQWFSDPNDWPSFMIGDVRRVLGVALPGLTYRLGVASSEFYYRPVSEMRRRAERLVARAPHPSFLYLHTMDLHGPYLPPQDLLPEDYRPGDFLSYFSLLRLAAAGSLETSGHESEVLNLKQRYAAELRFTDEELGRLFDRLDAAGLWEESLVWILSDHGESFGEQGFAGHGGRNMTSSVLQVPLVLKPPRSWGLELARVEAPVSTADVLPTTLGLLGLPQPRLRLGTDLTPLLRGGIVDREFTVISQATAGTTRILAGFEGHWKLELEIDTGNSRVIRTSLYNLATDPEQRVDLRRAHPTVVAGLQKKIRTFLATENRAFYEKLHEQLDQQTREQLQRLGYVE